MNMQQKFFWLMGSVFALLLVATIIGWIMHRRRGASS